MGNQTGKLSRPGKNEINIKESIPVDDTHHVNDHIQSNRMANEDICVTTRSENSTISSLEEREYASSTVVSNGSTSDLSTSGAQHSVRETTNNISSSIVDSNGIIFGDKIICYGAVSFVNSSQSNVQITNQQHAPIKHDFGELNNVNIG